MKQSYINNKGQTITLPWGFHIIQDLVPLFQAGKDSRAYKLSREGRIRLNFLEYYEKNGRNVSKTCRYFGISRKTFYYWKKRYNPYDLSTLENKSRAPKQKRQRDITPEEEERIVALRKKYITEGKENIAKYYEDEHGECVSAWKVQKVIEKHKLYRNPKKIARAVSKRKRARNKKRITELKKKQQSGFLLGLDTIVIYWNGVKRYIFTAIDSTSKIAFARMYTSKSSYNARDFLYRLNYLLENKIENVCHDNGSEFLGYFRDTCKKLGIEQYFSRNHTPKDNAVCERFNRTLQENFVNLGNFTPDTDVFNKNLTEWLTHYNFKRPHQSLGRIPPIEFQDKYLKVLPMYSSSTVT
jgi:transposase InsO family protein